MRETDYIQIRAAYPTSEELHPLLAAELRRTASRVVRFRNLPPWFAPYGAWNSEAEDEIFQDWCADRLIERGDLQALLDQAPNLRAFQRLAERSLHQHV